MEVRGCVWKTDDDDPSVGVDDLHMTVVQFGKNFRGHDFLRRPYTELAAGKVKDPVYIVDNRVDFVGHEDHGTVPIVALLVDQ